MPDVNANFLPLFVSENFLRNNEYLFNKTGADELNRYRPAALRKSAVSVDKTSISKVSIAAVQTL